MKIRRYIRMALKGGASFSVSFFGILGWFWNAMPQIAGWIYLFYLAFNKRVTDRRDFARAYLFYKLVFLLISAASLGILIYIGMGILDRLLAYMEML